MERAVHVLDPRLTRKATRVLVRAVKLSAKYGSGTATVESTYAALLKDPEIKPMAENMGFNPCNIIPFIRHSRPQTSLNHNLWDGEVDQVIDHAHVLARSRRARKAGIVDLLNVVARHQVTADLYLSLPCPTKRLALLAENFNQEQSQRRQIAS